jgi:hypothetical protein
MPPSLDTGGALPLFFASAPRVDLISGVGIVEMEDITGEDFLD